MYEVIAAIISCAPPKDDNPRSRRNAEDRFYEELGTPVPRLVTAPLRMLSRATNLWCNGQRKDEKPTIPV